jgi:phosphoserine phosphatase RsbU/P
MNHALLKQSEGDMFVTLVYAVLDLDSGNLDYCVAGHSPPWLLRGDGSIEFRKQVRGSMLGLFDAPPIGRDRLRMQPGDLLFLTTDGVIDAENAAGEDFTEERLRLLLADSLTRSSMEDLVDQLLDNIAGFSAGALQSDDITAMAVRFTATDQPLPE